MYYLLGGAGYQNFGDELMVRCWLEYLTSKGLDEANIVVDGSDRIKLRNTFSDSYSSAIYSDLLNKLSEAGDKPTFWNAAARGATFFDRGGFSNYPKLDELAEYLVKASVIHLHGGGYLNKHFPKKGFLLGLAVAASRKTGAVLVGTGLGLLPLDLPKGNLKDKAESWLEKFSLIETRDEGSAQLLRQISPHANIVSGLDDTFVGDVKYTNDRKHRLHLSWNFRRTGDEEFKRVIEYTRNFYGRYDEVVFWNCARNDSGTWEILHNEFPKIRKLDFQDMISKEMPVNPGDHMLTARFHPHLIAARGGATGGYFSPGSYYDVKHGSVCDIGSGFFRIPTTELNYEDFGRNTNELFGKAGSLRSLKTDLCADVYEFLQPS